MSELLTFTIKCKDFEIIQDVINLLESLKEDGRIEQCVRDEYMARLDDIANKDY